MSGLDKAIERLAPLVEGVDPIAAPVDESKGLAENDLMRTTLAVVLEQAPEGVSAEEVGNAIVVALGEVAEDTGVEPEVLREKFESWLKRVSESAQILSESLKE